MREGGQTDWQQFQSAHKCEWQGAGSLLRRAKQAQADAGVSLCLRVQLASCTWVAPRCKELPSQAFVSWCALSHLITPSTGIWSQIKRAPLAVKKRITFEVPGPSVEGAMPLDARARQIFG